MNPAKAVIFDMDGVIVDSEPRHEQAFVQVAESIGLANHGLCFENYVGRSDKELWVDFVARNNPIQSLQELLAMKRARVVELLRRDRPLFPGLMDLVKNLAAAAVPSSGNEELAGASPRRYLLGLASGSERAIVDEVLKLADLGKWFSATVSGCEIQKGKPAPDIFLKTAKILGIEPSECWVIEDSKPGIAAGLAAGMRVIAVTNTHSAAELANAHFVVESYEEIEPLIRKEDA